jgi:murein DD-endopeptidase MepM/ murein hydrolase activator NlpD
VVTQNHGRRLLTVTGRVRVALGLAILLALPALTPSVGAQTTEEKLDSAKKRYEQALARATIATAAYEKAYGEYVATQEDIDRTEQAVAEARRRLHRLQGHLAERAREAYLLGPMSSLELLLTAESFTEFSDRMVFLDRLAQDDADLVTKVSVTSEILHRLETDLDRQADKQARVLGEAKAHLAVVYNELDKAEALKQELADQLIAERRAAALVAAATGSRVIQGQALQACPAPGSSFVDSWGAPRSGGRTHQGTDMMAPYGTPVYAAQSGTVSHSSSDLGGIQAYVYGDGGDTTFYAHLQGYGGTPSGGHASAGTLIGYVGDTGNATGTPHLHFEYHPGGGGAVNPYPYLLAVC